MFESVSIRSPRLVTNRGLVNFGALAEKLVFYDRVTIVADYGTLQTLVQRIGPELLFRFISNGHLTVQYLKNMVGVYTHEGKHKPVCIDVPEKLDINVAIPEILHKAIDKHGRAQRLTEKYFSKIAQVSYDESVNAATSHDFADSAYVLSVVRYLLQTYAPGYACPESLVFGIEKDSDETFVVSTNIDFVAANASYHATVPASHSSLGPSMLLSMIQVARSNMYFAANLGAEMSAEEDAAAVVRMKMNQLADATTNSANQIEHFQDFIFDDSRAIAEIINSGERSFEDLYPVVEQARRFKDWLKDKEPAADLVKEYFAKAREGTWLDKLPSKTTRWLIFGGLGIGAGVVFGSVAAAVASLGLGAADTFLVDKLVKGWRPNHFVDGPLSAFVDSK